MRKPIFDGADQDRDNLCCGVICTKYGSRLEMSDLDSKGIVLFI